MVGVVSLTLDVPFLEDGIDFHCGPGSILEEVRKANIVMGHCGGSSGREVHGFAEVLIFSFGGCAIVEYEKVGWISWRGGAVSWDEREMFYNF